MKLASHKLDYKLKVLGDSGKNPMVLQDWIDIQNGDQDALKKMVLYCEKDVTGLRQVFWSLVPYVNRLPFSLGVLLNGDREGCPECGSNIKYKNGHRPSLIGLKQRWVCSECGNSWTDTRTHLPKKTGD